LRDILANFNPVLWDPSPFCCHFAPSIALLHLRYPAVPAELFELPSGWKQIIPKPEKEREFQCPQGTK
jgi:hypothetical protein